jgi:2-alkyl-3-oxoalkanoate reductase
MKIFVAGATGAVGRRLVLLLAAAGHEVAGLAHAPAKADLLRRIGATPIIADALDRAAVMDVVQQQKPEIVVHELTSIKKVGLRNFDQGFTETNRLRTEGTNNLLAAARAAGVRRFIAQSFAGWPYARAGGPVKTEEDPLDLEPPAAFRRTLEAIRYLESAIIGETAVEGPTSRGPRSSAVYLTSITLSMTIRPACRNPWRRRSAPKRHAGTPPGSPVSS